MCMCLTFQIKSCASGYKENVKKQLLLTDISVNDSSCKCIAG